MEGWSYTSLRSIGLLGRVLLIARTKLIICSESSPSKKMSSEFRISSSSSSVQRKSCNDCLVICKLLRSTPASILEALSKAEYAASISSL